jgi:hypothetical protein
MSRVSGGVAFALMWGAELRIRFRHEGATKLVELGVLGLLARELALSLLPRGRPPRAGISFLVTMEISSWD